MGYTLPTPREHAKALVTKKEQIESQIESQIAILKANSCTMNTPLVDSEGFPRDDMDIYAVRNARVRIIELRNDLSDIINEIGKALENVYDRPATPPSASEPAAPEKPFARVDAVAPESPASEAGLQREDLILKFGHLTTESFRSSSSLQLLADLVSIHENRGITIIVQRSGQSLALTLTPRKGWGGRGMLGCHIVPYSQ